MTTTGLRTLSGPRHCSNDNNETSLDPAEVVRGGRQIQIPLRYLRRRGCVGTSFGNVDYRIGDVEGLQTSNVVAGLLINVQTRIATISLGYERANNNHPMMIMFGVLVIY